MNGKWVYGIMAGAAFSAASVFAEETDVAALRSELADLTARLALLEQGADDSADKAEWFDRIKIKGDLRYRYESRDSDDSAISDKSRQRIRARIGAYGAVNDQVDFGIRLATGSSSSPTSTNQDIDGYGSSKPIWLDLAYMTLNFEQVDGLNATFGKMKQPWESVSDLVYDADLNPEGISFAYALPVSDALALKMGGGHFIFSENGGDDIQMSFGQIVADYAVSDAVSLKSGLNTYLWDNAAGAVQTSKNKNTVGIDFELLEAFAQVDLKGAALPIKVYGDYVQNMASGLSEDTAWMIGLGTKVGDVDLSYNFRDVGVDSIYADLADSDFHDGGTGGRGHKVSAKYKLSKNLTTGATYFMTETEGGDDVNTLQLDLAAKF